MASRSDRRCWATSSPACSRIPTRRGFSTTRFDPAPSTVRMPDRFRYMGHHAFRQYRTAATHWNQTATGGVLMAVCLATNRADVLDCSVVVSPRGSARCALVASLAVLLVLTMGCAPGVGTPAALRTSEMPPARLVVSTPRDETQPWLATLERPVDPTTLADVAEVAPVEFAACGGEALPSPDGRVLAMAVGVNGPMSSSPPLACNLGVTEMGLRLFDLAAWKWPTQDGGVHGATVRPMAWSPDGKRLYAVSFTSE